MEALAPTWPLTVTFSNGESADYQDVEDLECNLEFYDSNQDLRCTVKDAAGRDVYLVLEFEVKELRLAEQ